jgi:hypothetical protein
MGAAAMSKGGRALAFLAVLSSLAAGPPQQDTDEKAVRALVQQLDAEEPAQRDRARQDLIRKGRTIVPLLKSMLTDASGEMAGQIRAIVTRFEREELLERSLPPLRSVTIPKGKLTPEEIFKKVREQTGYRVSPYGMNLREPLEAGWEQAPVLQVLDDVCRRLGRGRPEPPPLRSKRSEESDFWGERRSEPAPTERIDLNGEAKPLIATAHHRQFRAAVTDIVITEQRSLQKSSTQAVLHLAVSAQPGTHPLDISSWDVQELSDDSGVSLRMEGNARAAFREEAAPDVGESADTVWFGGDRWGRFSGDTQMISMRPPSPGARKIAKLKASLRASFAAQEVTRTATLAEIKEKATVTLDFGAATIILREPEHKEGNFSLKYQLRGSSRGSPTIVLLDKEGAEIRNSGGGSSSSGADHHQTWYLRGAAEVGSIRVSAWIGHTTIEIPFEFTDLPLPGEK